MFVGILGHDGVCRWCVCLYRRMLVFDGVLLAVFDGVLVFVEELVFNGVLSVFF